MEIGLGVDSRIGLSTAQLRDLGPEAKALGYQSLWTNSNIEYDPIAMCVAWNQRTGLPSGVSVVPIVRNPPAVLALAGRSAWEISDAHFILGIGCGSVTDRPFKAVREYVAEVRKAASRVPIVIGALGPQMLKLASEIAQGAALNWCTPEQIRWSREIVGPRIRLAMYIRVSVDDDRDRARLALAQQILSYALLVRPSGARGYRAHFERMGFGPELTELEARRAKGASDDELARTMPERMVSAFGYYGDGSDAREKLAKMAEGLDVAIVRVLNPRTGDLGPVRRAMEAFAPAH